jgi:hypothetical protein
MGLGKAWLEVAATIGVDAFLAMWRVLDAYPANWHDSGTLRISIRRYSGYLRFQRNRYIEALGGQQPPLSIDEIRRRVWIAFGEKFSKNYLSQLCKRGEK